MKRLLIVPLLILATYGPALPQDRRENKGGRRAAAWKRISTGDVPGVTIRGNVIIFSSEWEIVKGADDNIYARKKKDPIVVLAVSCRCAQEGPGGTCFLQSVPGRNDALQCNKSFDCTGTCGVVTQWVEPKDIETIGLP